MHKEHSTHHKMGTLPPACHPCAFNIVYFVVVAFPGVRFFFRGIVGLFPRMTIHRAIDKQRLWLEQQAQRNLVFLTDCHPPNTTAQSNEEGVVPPMVPGQKKIVFQKYEGNITFSFLVFFRKKISLHCQPRREQLVLV